jgi:hypothetical protein
MDNSMPAAGLPQIDGQFFVEAGQDEQSSISGPRDPLIKDKEHVDPEQNGQVAHPQPAGIERAIINITPDEMSVIEGQLSIHSLTM